MRQKYLQKEIFKQGSEDGKLWNEHKDTFVQS